VDSETFWTNPQYCVEIVDFDEGDDDKTGTLIIALMQKERRKKKREGQDLLTIGYSVYKVTSTAMTSFTELGDLGNLLCNPLCNEHDFVRV